MKKIHLFLFPLLLFSLSFSLTEKEEFEMYKEFKALKAKKAEESNNQEITDEEERFIKSYGKTEEPVKYKKIPKDEIDYQSSEIPEHLQTEDQFKTIKSGKQKYNQKFQKRDEEKSNNEYLIIGYDLGGKHKITAIGLTGETGVDSSLSFGVESIDREGIFGFGVKYYTNRKQANTDGNFGFLSSYLMTRFWFNQNEKSYFIFRLGINTFFGDSDYKGSGNYATTLSGGGYASLGVGLKVSDGVMLEIVSEANSGSAYMAYYNLDIAIMYSSLSCSIKFTI